jgi:hypothetical protein
LNANVLITTVPSVTPTPYQLKKIKTPVVTATKLNLLNEYDENECLVIDNIMNPDLFGTVVLLTFVSHETKLLNLQSNKEIEIGIVEIVMAVSPNQKKLAYISENPPVLHIIDGNGVELMSKLALPEWKSVIKWIDEENLLIAETTDNLGSNTIVFNLQNGILATYKPEFPFYKNGNVNWENYRDSKMIFSPDFSLVIYPQYGKGGYVGYIVYDINKKRIVFEQNKIPEWFAPIWSDDSSFFISGLYPKYYDNDGDLIFDNNIDDLSYMGGSDLFIVSKNGEILERLTSFSSMYVASEEKISLSSDQQKLAFWVNLSESRKDKNEVRELVIMDLETKKMQFTCLTVEGRDPGPIIWSPDDQYLLVNYGSSKVDQGIVFVDLNTWNATQMDWKNQIAEAWLVNQ